MNPRHLRAAVESFYADVWNRQDTSRIPRLLDPHFTFRGSLGETRTGHDGFASYLDFVHGAVSGFTCDILEVVVEPPKVFARVRFSGNHRGPLLGFPPTGKPVEWLGAALFTFSGEQIADLWVLGDVDGLTKLLERNADD